MATSFCVIDHGFRFRVLRTSSRQGSRAITHLGAYYLRIVQHNPRGPVAAGAAIFVIVVGLLPWPAHARDVRGHVEVRGVFYPALDLTEGRMRLLVRYERAFGRWQIVASACGEGIAGTLDRVTSGIVRPLETFLDYRGSRAEFRVGLSNVAWGVLDELSPQDVVSPIDVSRFVLDDRAEARLPVPLARVRLFLPASLTIEGVVVPLARRGWFDQLDEPHSPFAPPGLYGLPRSEPQFDSDLIEGGVRLRGSGSGIDWGLSAYRDVVDFDRYEASAAGLTAQRPARWMAGADVEAALGDWVLRLDGAAFFDDPLQAGAVPGIVRRDTYSAGVGADRRFGETAVYVNALYTHVPEDPQLSRDSEVSVFGGLTRDFAQGTRTIRLFGLWGAESESGFGRLVWDHELLENLRLDVSGGVFFGDGGTALGAFGDTDFVSARLRIFF
jgi:hypothetical protein